MSNVKQPSKRKRRSKAVPVLGIAGVSLAMAGGASAATTGQATDTLSQNTSPRHEVFLGEEEISDVSLSTFYVFDKENAAKPQAGEKVAWGCRCGGCRGCGGCRCVRLERLRRLRRLRRLVLLLLGTLPRLLNGTVRILLPMQIVLAGSFDPASLILFAAPARLRALMTN